MKAWKNNIWAMNRVIIAVLLCFLGLSMGVSSAEKTADIAADVVWAATDGERFELFKTSLKNGKWSEPEQITNDNADNLHPCLDTASDGTKWLVWTAVEQGGYEIRYSRFRNGTWEDPQVFPSPLASNIAPAIAIDSQNIPWIVWSGNDGEHNDEIFYSRYVHGKWEEPRQVNAPNNVPDILPLISKNDAGVLEVVWQGFRDGRYVALRSQWNGHGWSSEVPVAQEDTNNDPPILKRIRQKSADKDVLELPHFVPDSPQVFIKVYQP